MFDPNQQPAECEKYLGRFLGSPVKFIRASQLTQNTRAAPWRLDVAVNGQEQAYVLQLDARGLNVPLPQSTYQPKAVPSSWSRVNLIAKPSWLV